MRRWFMATVLGASLGMGTAIAAPLSDPNVPAVEPAPVTAQNSFERLSEMFSPDIRTTVEACWDAGKVNLSPTNATSPWVLCGDGSAVEGVTYANYVDTIADVMAASTLLGIRVTLANDNRLTPEMLALFVSTEQGRQLLQDLVQTAIIQSELQSSNQPASSQVLTEAVVERLQVNLQNPSRLEALLGTSQQYSQVVARFCTAPGMSLADAMQQFSGLDSIQLYAICIDESGAVADAFQGP